MSLTDELNCLQWKQLNHDENYHKDISLLNVRQRLKHMTLHFAKYVGQLAFANYQQNVDLFAKTCLDGFIIATSSANILNLNLSELITSEEFQSSTLNELAVELADIDIVTRSTILRDFTIDLGLLAKANEAIDHLETFLYRDVLSEQIVRLFKTSMSGFALCSDKELLISIQERMVEVERKSIFFEKLGNYKDGYNDGCIHNSR